jgi:hypothetical protein
MFDFAKTVIGVLRVKMALSQKHFARLVQLACDPAGPCHGSGSHGNRNVLTSLEFMYSKNSGRPLHIRRFETKESLKEV